MRGLWREDVPKPMRGLLAGAVGGLLASWIMNEFQAGWSKVSEEVQFRKSGEQEQQSQKQKKSPEGSENAMMKAAGKLAKVTLGRNLSEDEKKKAGPVVHYVFGTLTGAAYGLLAEYVPVSRLGFGSLFGAVLFLVADEMAVPAFGLSKKPTEYPLSSHVYGLASHLVYGVSIEAVRKGICHVD